jgi:hypothetical protein
LYKVLAFKEIQGPINSLNAGLPGYHKTFREHPGNIQGTSKENPGKIQ